MPSKAAILVSSEPVTRGEYLEALGLAERVLEWATLQIDGQVKKAPAKKG